MTNEHVSVPRDEFEKWMIEEMGYPRADLYFASARNCYRSYHVHLAWKAWEQAILSRATPSDDDFYCCNGVDCGCQGITKREYAEACSKNPSAPRVVTELVSIEDHNRLTTGPSPWTNTRVEKAAFNAARSVFGTSTSDDDARVYRTLQAYIFAASLPAAMVPDGLSAWVSDMKTSAGMDYYVCVGFRDRSKYLTPNLYKIRGRAEFDVAEWNHLLGLGPKPDLLAFDTEAAAPQAGERG